MALRCLLVGGLPASGVLPVKRGDGARHAAGQAGSYQAEAAGGLGETDGWMETKTLWESQVQVMSVACLC